MTPNEDFDADLAAAFAEPDLPDAGFTRHWMSRLARERRRRRSIIGAASVVGAAGVCSSWFSAQAWLPIADLSPASLAATLTLTGLCAIVWVVTEIRS
ncbi:MAG: hypothetical protein HC872_02770 [Gammaproteobacteria bacterium]|nr:hypothetical protein [Gammaproteobacteria bacterium]